MHYPKIDLESGEMFSWYDSRLIKGWIVFKKLHLSL